MNDVSVFGSRTLKDKIKGYSMHELTTRLLSLSEVLRSTSFSGKYQHTRKSIENEVNIIEFEIKARRKEAHNRLMKRASLLSW